MSSLVTWPREETEKDRGSSTPIRVDFYAGEEESGEDYSKTIERSVASGQGSNDRRFLRLWTRNVVRSFCIPLSLSLAPCCEARLRNRFNTVLTCLALDCRFSPTTKLLPQPRSVLRYYAHSEKSFFEERLPCS